MPAIIAARGGRAGYSSAVRNVSLPGLSLAAAVLALALLAQFLLETSGPEPGRYASRDQLLV